MNTNQKSEKGDFISYLKQQWDAFSMNTGLNRDKIPKKTIVNTAIINRITNKTGLFLKILFPKEIFIKPPCGII